MDSWKISNGIRNENKLAGTVIPNDAEYYLKIRMTQGSINAIENGLVALLGNLYGSVYEECFE